MSQQEDKRVFLICTSGPQRSELYANVIKNHITNTMVFIAQDGPDALFKMGNCPPHVVILDAELPRLSGYEIIDYILADKKLNETHFIITSAIPDKEQFVNEVVTGQVQFLNELHNEKRLNQCLVRALNSVMRGEQYEYRLKFLAPNEVLFKEGEEAFSVFIVKRGELVAIKGEASSPVTLGRVQAGEFVGEMAHFNSEPRSATVKAVSDCELIEIPRDTLDSVLFTKPAWSKALVANLSTRLKNSNEALLKVE